MLKITCEWKANRTTGLETVAIKLSRSNVDLTQSWWGQEVVAFSICYTITSVFLPMQFLLLRVSFPIRLSGGWALIHPSKPGSSLPSLIMLPSNHFTGGAVPPHPLSIYSFSCHSTYHTVLYFSCLHRHLPCKAGLFLSRAGTKERQVRRLQGPQPGGEHLLQLDMLASS